MKFSLNYLLLGICAFTIYFSLIDAHGMMCGPRQRAAYKSTKCGDLDDLNEIMQEAGASDSDMNNVDHCAHCLNGGGAGTVKEHLGADGWTLYEPVKDFDGTAARTGICGDALGSTDHMIGGSFMTYKNVPIVQKWKEGSAVDFSVELDTNHNGYFDFFLCNLDTCGTTDIDGKCFKDGHCVKLNRVAHPDCEDASVDTHQECGPIDEKYPGRFYVPCRKGGHVGVHIVGGSSGTMRYQLPKNFRCKHCVLQWYWATANSCAPRGFLNYFENYNNPFGTTCPADGGALGGRNPTMGECGGANQPEEFWSCADVQITKDGKSAGPITSVASPDTGSTTPAETPAPETDPAPTAEADHTRDMTSTSPEEKAAKENPAETVEKAKKEIKEDIEMAASESTGEKKREEQAAAAGECVAEEQSCDGSSPCCDVAQVCVYTKGEGFVCRFWWSLWKDVNDRREGL